LAGYSLSLLLRSFFFFVTVVGWSDGMVEEHANTAIQKVELA
jgi:hypothetical protein